MLKAFQKQLDELANRNDGSFEEILQSRLGKDLPKELPFEMKEFIRLLPVIEERIFSLYVLVPSHSKIRDIGSYFLTYMYQPDDYIPENEKNGLFGYLDDAYLAALFFELMVEELERKQFFRLRNKDRELLLQVIGLRRKARMVIPDEAIKIKEMIGGLFLGDDEPYQDLMKSKPSLN